MTDWTVVISTLAGGFIAGIVGLFSTYTSRYLDRRERHLNEHKDNFALIDRALYKLKNKVWPFEYGWEYLKLDHVKHIPRDSPKLSILGITLSDPELGDEPEDFVMVDKGLYKDMNNHFKILAEKLKKYEETIKKDGSEISKFLEEISEEIYSEMYKSELQVLNWPFEKGEKALLRGFKGQAVEQEYAGIIFLLVVGQDENTWRQTKETYEKYGLYTGLKEIADKIRAGNEDKISNTSKLLIGIDELKKECHELLEKEEHSFKLKGRCEYVKFKY